MERENLRGKILQAEVGESTRAYELGQILGTGGQAVVYQGWEDRGTERTVRAVAVRLYTPSLSSEEQENFRTEAQRSIELRHENIIRTEWAGIGRVALEGYQRPYPAMISEFADGGSLADRMRKQHLSLEESVNFIEQASSGLQYAHDKKILHRDVKPANLLLQNEKIKVADFGIAIKLHELYSHTLTTQLPIGTLPYMAPEAFEAKAKRQSDIYSLGVVAYQLATRRLPIAVQSANPVVYYKAHSNNVPRSFSLLDLEQDEKLEAIEPIILTALEKSPERRQSTAAQFGNELREAYEQGKVKSEKETTYIDLGRLSTRELLPTPKVTQPVPELLADLLPPQPNKIKSREKGRMLKVAKTIGALSILISPIALPLAGMGIRDRIYDNALETIHENNIPLDTRVPLENAKVQLKSAVPDSLWPNKIFGVGEHRTYKITSTITDKSCDLEVYEDYSLQYTYRKIREESKCPQGVIPQQEQERLLPMSTKEFEKRVRKANIPTHATTHKFQITHKGKFLSLRKSLKKEGVTLSTQQQEKVEYIDNYDGLLIDDYIVVNEPMTSYDPVRHKTLLSIKPDMLNVILNPDLNINDMDFIFDDCLSTFSVEAAKNYCKKMGVPV